jgi:hypothetical protein
MQNSPETKQKRNMLRAKWKREIKSNTIPKTTKRVCKICGQLKDCGWNYTFSSTGKPEYRTKCVECYKIYLSELRKTQRTKLTNSHRKRMIRGKKRAIQYLGGRCAKCGYNKAICALTFHHRDRTSKLGTVGQMLDWSWKKLKQELDKCDLLCFNCHMELHGEKI